jgi:hypothetical protein
LPQKLRFPLPPARLRPADFLSDGNEAGREAGSFYGSITEPEIGWPAKLRVRPDRVT